MCNLCVHTLVKVASHYDLIVLSMSLMAFQKQNWIGGLGGWVG